MKALFQHHFPNPDGMTDPGNDIALIDNAGQMLDHANALAKSLSAGAFAELLTPEDIHHAAWALALQIADARETLDRWHSAKHR